MTRKHRTRIVVWHSERQPYHAQCNCGWQAKSPVVNRATAERHACKHRKEHE